MSFLSLMLTACASSAVMGPDDGGPSPAKIAVDAAEKSWWSIYFRIRNEPSEEPEWHIDALIADRVLAPIIVRTESGIALWRFHRRAANDAAGHRFSFVFYADRATARDVNLGVEQSTVARSLREAGFLIETGLADLSGTPDAALEATSDRSWPDAIQRSWPWFIMGVSQSWLRLIREVRKTHPLADNATTAELIRYYRNVHEEISALWREHGQHAYLHHLSALFAYQPLIIRDTTLKRF